MWLPGIILGFVVIIAMILFMLKLFRKAAGQEGPTNANMAMWDRLNQEEMQQLVGEIQDVADNVHQMNVRIENTVKKLRTAADFLDKVWQDCKIASAVGTGANITGGVLTIAGGVATIMTFGLATPLLIAGGALGVAGSCVNLGTTAVEESIKSSVIQEADEAVRNVNYTIENVKQRIRELKTGKSQARLVLLAALAIRMLGKDHLVVAFLKDLLRTDVLAKSLPTIVNALQSVKGLAFRALEKVTDAAKGGLIEGTSKQALSVGINVGARKCTDTGAKIGGGAANKVGANFVAKGARRMGKRVGSKAACKVGTKAVSKKVGNGITKQGTTAVGKATAKQAGGVIIGVSAAFLVLDAIDLAFTVRDLVTNEGSDAARILRCKADEYETILEEQENE
ncbi:uncharacterized protein [Montipora capricornis]|uniref:uncharacterized protein n=1 Tax=Montipora capricornis TaxID=246305 RepID=UPI0035F14804